MVIGYDAKKIVYDRDDTAEYGRMMIDALSGNYIHNHYIIYTPQEMENKLLSPFLSRSTVHLKTPRHAIIGWKWHRGKGILHDAKRHGVRVFHGLNGMLPSPLEQHHMHSVVNVPFTQFIDQPGVCSWTERHLLARDVAQSTAFAERIITSTHTTKQSLIDHYRIDEQRIAVVYPGCEQRYYRTFADNELHSIAHKYGLPQRYILLVGDITPTSGAMMLTEALNQLKDEHVRLVLIGKRTAFYQKQIKEFVHAHGIRHRLMHISKVHDADMPAIMRLATVVALPIAGQHNVLPLVKTQACLTATVVADDAVAREVGGDAALYATEGDHMSFAHAIDNILDGNGCREKLIEAARRRQERFTAQAMARDVMAVYESVCEHRHIR